MRRGRRAPPTAAGGCPRRTGGGRGRRAAAVAGARGCTGHRRDRRVAAGRPIRAACSGPRATLARRARRDAVVGVPTAGRRRHRGPRRRPGPGAGPGRPRGRRAHPAPPRRARRRGRSTACACCGPTPICPGCPTTTSSPRWRRPTTSSSQLAARLGGWRPDVVHAHDWLVAWAGDTLHDAVGRAAGRHDPRHRARPQRRPPAAGPAGGDQQRRVVADLPGHAGDLLLAVHGRRGHRRRSSCRRTRSTWCPTASTRTLGRRRPADGRRGRDEPLIVVVGPGPVREGLPDAGPRARPRCATAVPGVRSVIAGRGSYLAELQATAQAVGRGATSCDFAGFVPDDELQAPAPRGHGAPSSPRSTSRSASSPWRRWPPARRSSRPRSGGLVEVIDGTGAGLLYPPGDAGALSGTLRRVLAQPDALADQQAAAFALLERRYTWDEVAEATVPVYEPPPPAPLTEPPRRRLGLARRRLEPAATSRRGHGERPRGGAVTAAGVEPTARRGRSGPRWPLEHRHGPALPRAPIVHKVDRHDRITEPPPSPPAARHPPRRAGSGRARRARRLRQRLQLVRRTPPPRPTPPPRRPGRPVPPRRPRRRPPPRPSR